MKLGEQKRFIVIGVATLLAAALWVALRPGTRSAGHRPDDMESAASPNASPANTVAFPHVASSVIITPVPAEQRQKVIDQLDATTIVFFGKVIDQHEVPVPNARVTYTVHHLTFRGNPSVEGPVTDKNGRFEIRTQGPSITVSVSHPQFYQGKDAERQIDYGSETTVQPYQPRPTRDSPILFRLVRKGDTEPLIEVPSREVRLSLDDRPVEISFGEPSLKIAVRLHSESSVLKPNEFRHFDWSLTLAVSNGGLIERVNSLDFQAPETGYLPQVEIEMPSGANARWSSRINKDYFVHFANGKYGRFQISVSGETGFCRFESYLNPSGSRNLEVDPTKLVKASVSPEN